GDLKSGNNSIQFLVSDTGSGPVGLNVQFSGDIGGGSLGGAQLCTPNTIIALQPAGNLAGVGTGTNPAIINNVTFDTSFCIISSTITDPQAKPIGPVPAPAAVTAV